MKKYIFKDGTELRGVVVSERGNGFRDTDILIDENLERHVLEDMGEIERITFVRGIDEEFRDALEGYKKANEKYIKRYEEIEELVRELHREQRELHGKNHEARDNLDEVYKSYSGLYTEEQFRDELQAEIKNYLLSRYDEVEHGITTMRSSVFIHGNSIRLTIPVDMVRHPQEGTWDLFLEYDNTLHSYSEDMTDEVLKVQRNIGFDLNGTKERMDNLSVLKLNNMNCQTSVGDKIATLDVNINFEFQLDRDLSEEYLNEVLKDIKEVL